MQNNKLRMAIRATAAAAALGMASQVGAVDLSTDDVNVNLYGFARIAASYDIDEDISSGGQSGSYGKINTTDTDGATGHFGADAVTSRVGVAVTSKQGVKAVVEYDFDRDNSLTPRLRLAYGEYKNWQIGQNWSNFTSFVGNTSVLDFDALPGNAGIQGRTVQGRYTNGPLSLSLEESSASILGATEVKELADPVAVDPENPDELLMVGTGEFTDASVTAKKSLPAITARLEDSAGGLSYSAAVMAHQVGYDDGDDDESAFGFATFVAAKMALTDMITLQGSLSYSDGANSYLYRSGEDFGAESAYVDANGDVETISGYGGTVGAGISLGGGRSINIGYGIATVDWDDAEDDLGASVVGDKSETNQAVMANYQWTPVENVKMGVEYQFLERENVDGSDGDANRVLFVSQYIF